MYASSAGGYVAAAGATVEVAVEDLHLLFELRRSANEWKREEELLPLCRLLFLS